MEWYVFYHNPNKQKIELFNIFKHNTFKKYIKEHLEKCEIKEEFEPMLKSELQYYFWSKSEYEIILSPWCGGRNTKDIKIDIYDQVMSNWEVFVDFVWTNREEILKEVNE